MKIFQEKSIVSFIAVIMKMHSMYYMYVGRRIYYIMKENKYQNNKRVYFHEF